MLVHNVEEEQNKGKFSWPEEDIQWGLMEGTGEGIPRVGGMKKNVGWCQSEHI